MNVPKRSSGMRGEAAQSEEASGQPELEALQEQLRAARSEQQSAVGILRDILYGADVATFLLDAALRIEFFTPSAEMLFHVLSTDVGRPFMDLAMVARDDALEADMRDVAGGRSNDRTALVTMYGKSYHRRVSPRRPQRDHVGGVVVSYTDVTATRSAQEEARASYEQVRNVVMMLPAPAAIVDDHGNLAMANPRFDQVLADHPDLLVQAVEQWRNLSDPDPSGPLTFAVEGLGTVQLSIAAVPAMAANPMHVIAVEPEQPALPGKQRYVADLEHLNQLRHEVIQPLQTLRMLHGIMIKRLADGNEIASRTRLEETYEALSGMLNSLFLQQELINGLTDAHPDQNIALGDIIDSLRPELGYHAAARGLDWDIEPCNFSVRTEPRLLECLIRGLMLRVVRGMSRGRLVLGFQAVGDRVVVGFRPHLDELGAQSDKPTALTRSEKVNELLFPHALINQLAESLNVEVLFGSEAPDDALCTISIPAADHAPDAERRQADGQDADSVDGAQRPPHAGRGEVPEGATGGRICIVDDDELLLKSVAEALAARGFETVTCNAVDAFFARRPAVDCIVVDAMMPDKDGFALMEQLAAQDDPPPIIMITGAGDVKLAVRAMKTGAADFIEKPFDVDQLAEAVRRVCREAGHQSPRRPQFPAAPYDDTGLTERQKQVLELVVAGHANKEIAARLNISQRTVENHRAAVMRRTGARTLPDLIRKRLLAEQPPANDRRSLPQ